MMPGLLLSGLYLLYVLGLCLIRPSAGPVAAATENGPSFREKIAVTVKALLPPALLIVAVGLLLARRFYTRRLRA